jgi:thiol-disulfide isomerase/thioredoxin
MFICNHCPFVKHVREELARLGRDYDDRSVAVYAINSNDSKTYTGDSPEMMKRESNEWGYTFPYLIDADQKTLVYRGQLDDSRPGNGAPINGRDVRAALDAVLAGEPVSPEQVPGIGCNIKWLPGNAPDYY